MAESPKRYSQDGLVDRLLASKSRYPGLHRIITDSRLIRAARSTADLPSHTAPLTLPSCLLISDLPEIFGGLPPAKALDLNVQVLLSAGAIKRPSRLAAKLLNPGDFLNTTSELALARTLYDQSWTVELDKKFFGESDVDILASGKGQEEFIDVINLAAEPLELTSVYMGTARLPKAEDRIVTKIVGKCEAKFAVAVKQDWSGRAWIALDIAKRDESLVDTIACALFVPGWSHELARLVLSLCPELAGMIVYRSDARFTHVDVIVSRQRSVS